MIKKAVLKHSMVVPKALALVIFLTAAKPFGARAEATIPNEPPPRPLLTCGIWADQWEEDGREVDRKRIFLDKILKKIKGLELSQTTPLFKKFFGEQPVSLAFCDYLKKGVNRAFFATEPSVPEMIAQNKWDQWTNIAEMILELGFFDQGVSDLDRMATLIHEARHSNLNTEHEICPTPFLDDQGHEIRSLVTGRPLAGFEACDHRPTGAYGYELVWLGNLARFCTNCSTEERHQAQFLFDKHLWRITNLPARQLIIEDLTNPDPNAERAIAKYQRAMLARTEKVSEMTPLMAERQNPGVVRSLEATPLLNPNYRCGGVLVSDSGYLVTALHCLMATEGSVAFTDEWVVKPTRPNEGWDLPTVTVLKPDHPQTVTFPMDGHSDQRAISADVILAGKGYPERFPNEKLRPDTVQPMQGALEDFVILKLKDLPKGRRCAQVRRQENSLGEKIWLVGYPRLEDSKSPFISTGTLFPDFKTASRFVPYLAGRVDYADAISNPQVYLATTAAAAPGFSGGGVFAADGIVVGITSMTALYGNALPPESLEVKPRDQRLFRYGTSIVSMNHILQRVEAALGPQMRDEIFHCQP